MYITKEKFNTKVKITCLLGGTLLPETNANFLTKFCIAVQQIALHGRHSKALLCIAMARPDNIWF